MQLIERSRTGDDDAIEELVRIHHHEVYGLALSLLREPAAADAAAQETFVKALESLDKFRGDSSFSTWLYSITLNVCRDRMRKQGARERMRRAVQALFRLDNAFIPDPEADVIQKESRVAVSGAVNDLRDKYRVPIILRYGHGLRIADIARIMDVSERTVYNRLRTAHQQLHRLLKEGGFIP